MVLREGERSHGRAVGEGDERVLRTGESLLDDHVAIGARVGDGGVEGRTILGQGHALASCEAGFLHDDRPAEGACPCAGALGVGRAERGGARAGDAKPLCLGTGERLGTFEARPRLRGAEHAASGHGGEGVGQPSGEGRLRSDDDEVDAGDADVIDEGRNVGGVDGDSRPWRAGVPRGDVKQGGSWRRGDGARNGVFTAAAANNQDAPP